MCCGRGRVEGCGGVYPRFVLWASGSAFMDVNSMCIGYNMNTTSNEQARERGHVSTLAVQYRRSCKRPHSSML